MDGLDILMGYFSGLFAILCVLLIISIVCYVVTCFAIFKVLKILEYQNSWMAWLPLLQMYALADVTRDEDGFAYVFNKQVPGMLFNFWWLIAFFVAMVPGIGPLLSLAMQVICMGSCLIPIYATIDDKSESDVTAFAFVSAFFPIIWVIKFLTA